MPDSPEATSNTPLTRKCSPSITGSWGRGQQTPEALTSDTRSRQEESTSAAEPRKRALPKERIRKKAKRPDQQLYVPRRGRNPGRTSSESQQSVKQSIKEPDHKEIISTEKPVLDLGDSCERTDHKASTRTSPRLLEGDTFESSKTPSCQDLNNLSTKQGKAAGDDHPADRHIDQCLPSSCKISSEDLENIRLNSVGQTAESPNKVRESECNDVPLSKKSTLRGNPANDFVLESNSEVGHRKLASSNASTPALEQPQKLACDRPLENTHNICNKSQITTEKLQTEGYEVVAADDQTPLPTEEIMAEDATRLESTGISGSGDDVTAENASESRLDGGEKDDARKEEAEEEEEEEEDSWDTMFDEEGNSLKEDEIKEITDAVGGVSVSVKKPAHDYLNFSPKDNTDYSKLEHVIEVHDFPSDFKTEDLVMSFNAFKNKGFDIKWVDDTHALAVFATAQVASDALGLQNPMLRTRPLSLASKQSKQKAKSTVEFLQPYKPRPETSSLAARRMVSNALGVKSNVSREQRVAERQKLKEAKDKRRDEKKQKANIWDGNI